jgi:hypothetical protein
VGREISAFEGLEPYDGKLSRTVLRGAKGRKALSYPVQTISVMTRDP